MSYCLPKDLVLKFKAAVDSGFLKPIDIAKLTSQERFDRIATVVGEDNAKQVNVLFEKGLLFERRKLGFSNWVKQVSGEMSVKARENVVDKINGLDERILNPHFEKNFLADLAAEKVGAKVSPEQAKEIFDLAKIAKDAKTEWEKNLDVKAKYRDLNNPIYKNRIDYGDAIRHLQDKIDEVKPGGRGWLENTLDTALIPKTVATGILHLSAFGVQGWGLLGRTATYEAFAHQFKYLWDQKHYDELMSYIVSHPDYHTLREAGLGLVDISDQLSSREEAMQSSLLQRLNTYIAEKGGEALDLDKPLPVNLVGASSRAFTGFLNYQRFTVASQLLDKARRTQESIEGFAGEILDENSQIVNDIVKVVNNFSGRGGLGPAEGVQGMQKLLNALFFAPRKVVATVQMFNPVEYVRLYKNAFYGDTLKEKFSKEGFQKGNFTAANAAIRNLVSSLVITGTVLGAAKAFGYGVDYNPTSQDFLKIEHGDMKYDITGGNAIWVRLMSRMLAGKEITARNKEIELNGSGFNPVTRASLATKYISGKFSPAAGIITDAMMGEDAVGNEFSLEKEVRDRMQPIFMSSVMNYFQQNPEKSVYDLPILASMFGIQAESPTPPLIRHGMNTWGEKVSLYSDPVRPPFEIALDKTGYIPNFPGDTIKGVKLTDDQYSQYIHLSGSLSRTRLENLLQSQGFAGANTKIQQLEIKKYVDQSRKQAGALLEQLSMGSDNDIVVKSQKNLEEKYGIEDGQ